MIKNSRTVPGFKPAHDLWCAGEAGPCAMARRPAVRPSKYPARSARARRGARAPPVVTAWWPRARRWASTAGGVQPGDEVRGIQWLQLTWEEGEMSGKDIRGGAHPSSGTSMERWGRGGAARWHLADERWWRHIRRNQGGKRGPWHPRPTGRF
jgi:hypothetical protein